MTTEERAQRRLERTKKREEYLRQDAEDRLRWPGTCIEGHQPETGVFAQILVEEGWEHIMLRIRKYGKWNKEGGGGDCEHFRIDPTLPEVLGLIRALAIRYNAIVERMNRDAAGIVIPQLPTIPQAEDIDRATPPQ